MFIFPNCSSSPVEILDLLASFSVLYFKAIPVNGSVFETTKSKAAFALSKSNSCVVK